MLHLLFLLLLTNYISALRCPLQENYRIVGGSYAKHDQFPYQVSIQVAFQKKVYDHICGGGIVGRKWILTAAQCLQFKVRQYRIVAGITGLDDTGESTHQTRRAKRFYIHPSYNYTNAHTLSPYDAALIKIKELKYNSAIQPLHLPKYKSQPVGTAVVAGWGSVDKAGKIFVKRLKYIEVFIPSDSDCHHYYPNFHAGVNFCVCSFNKDFCRGDGGSPLVQNGTVVGLVCGNDYICATTAPSIYTKVSALVPFILKHIG